MFIYLAIIGFVSSMILLFSTIIQDYCTELELWYTLLMIVIHIFGAFVIDAIVAFVVNQLPNKWFNHNYKIYKIFKWEKKFYNFINIKRWKDKIPELGKLANFRKNKVENPNDNEYVAKFIEESCYGEVVHFVSIFLGFLIIFILPEYALLFGIPIGIGNAVISFLSLAILRYNRPKLTILYERNKRRSNRNE